MRIVLLISIAFVELFALSKWLSCRLFTDLFYFTPQMMTARLIHDLNANQELPLTLNRLLHNKVIYFLWGSAQTYLQYWDIRFLKAFVGIVGAIGIILGIWYIVTKFYRRLLLWILIGLVSIFCFIELFLQPIYPFIMKLIVLGVFFQGISLFGYWHFLAGSKKLRYGFIIVLMLLSILTLLLFPQGYSLYCISS